MRARRLNTALWVPDEFMRRVKHNEDRYLFDPHECPILPESYGNAFDKAYHAYIEQAEAGNIRVFKKMKAKDLYSKMLIMAAKTGNYWFNFKDTHNKLNPTPDYALIHSSNMCTEISLPNTPESTATCTLASIVLSNYISDDIATKNVVEMTYEEKIAHIDTDDIIYTAGIAIQALDNVLDLNHFVTDASKK